MTTDARAVQTVTGRIPPEALGRTLIHEHVLIGFPGWNLDALAPRFVRSEAMSRAVDQMHELRGLGVGTFVDPCPMDLGRDVEFLAELAQKSGMQIVCTTGAYFEAEGITHTFRHLPVEDITAIYIKEITDGVGDTGIGLNNRFFKVELALGNSARETNEFDLAGFVFDDEATEAGIRNENIATSAENEIGQGMGKSIPDGLDKLGFGFDFDEVIGGTTKTKIGVSRKELVIFEIHSGQTPGATCKRNQLPS